MGEGQFNTQFAVKLIFKVFLGKSNSVEYQAEENANVNTEIIDVGSLKLKTN
jgi:hypothetical protein